MAGGEVRFGTASIYMAAWKSIRSCGTNHISVITWLRHRRFSRHAARTSAGLTVSGRGKLGLVLQLRFMSSVVGLGRTELMALSPSGPRQDERRAQGRSQQQLGNETSDFWHAGQAEADGGYAANAGLVLFGLPNSARRSEACNLAGTRLPPCTTPYGGANRARIWLRS